MNQTHTGWSVSVSPSTPAFEDEVSVSHTTPDNFKGVPVVYVQAFQNGELVFSVGGYDSQLPGGVITSAVLGPSTLWQGGAAQGKAKVGYFDPHTGHETIKDEFDFEIAA